MDVEETQETNQAPTTMDDRFAQIMEGFGEDDVAAELESDLESRDLDADSEDEGTREDEDEDADSDEDDEDEEEVEGEENEGEEDDPDEERKSDEQSFLDPKTLKKHQERIEKDPSLKAVYREMQRGFTQKTQQLAALRREYEEAFVEVEDLTATLKDTSVGGGREIFLLEAALENPELFQRAFDRAVELQENPEKRKQYDREQKEAERDRELDRREARLRHEEGERKKQEFNQLVTAQAKKMGLQDGDEKGMKLIRTYVGRVIRAHFQEHRNLDVPRKDLVAAIREAYEDLEEIRGSAAATVKNQEKSKRLKEAKETIKNSKSPQPLRGRGGTVALGKPPKKSELPPGVSPIDARIRQIMGLDK